MQVLHIPRAAAAHTDPRTKLARWQRNILSFCREALAFEPTEQQRGVLEAVQRARFDEGPRKIAVSSGKGVGKTCATSAANLWWIFPHVDTLTVATAPTARQVEEVWISETRRHLEKSPEEWFRNRIEVTAKKITIAKRKEWQTRTFAASNKESAQGWHQDHLAAFVEEASGVENIILETLEDTLTNEDHAFVLIGNPTRRGNYFHKCFVFWHRNWSLHTLNAEESPLWSQEKIQDYRERYGVDSDYYRVAVKGEFPLQDPLCVISEDYALRGMEVPEERQALLLDEPRVIAIDFARHGRDTNVIVARMGGVMLRIEETRECELIDTAAVAFRIQRDLGWTNANTTFVLDAGGMGQGIIGEFTRAGKTVEEFHFGGTPLDTERYENRVTEAYFHLADELRAGRVSLLRNTALLAELTTREYSTHPKNGKLVVEPKDVWIKRTESDHSPDHADACIMAFCPLYGASSVA